MNAIRKEAREVLEQALALGLAIDREKARHRKASEKVMVQAAENVYAAHLMELIDPGGFTPSEVGEAGRAQAREAAREGQVLTARAYGLILGYSEAYVSRLYRLGFGMAAGVLDPYETHEDGSLTRWQLLARSVGDTPEVGEVLGKDVGVLPTVEAVEAAIVKAQERKKAEREAAALERAQMPDGPIPPRPSEQIDLLQDLVSTIKHGRHLTPRQIERMQATMDEIRLLIEEWMSDEAPPVVPHARAS